MKFLDGNESVKVKWDGTIRSIQPRTRVWRYLTDNRTHYHLGYNLFLTGDTEEGLNEYAVAISEKQQQKGGFMIGDRIQGTAWTRKYTEREFAHYYRAGALNVIEKNSKPESTACPWTGQVPPMDVYEKRGARMLSKSLWEGECHTCVIAGI